MPAITKGKAGVAAAVVAAAVGLAKPAEGLYTRWYVDPVGVPTVCFGHTGRDIDRSKTYTPAECDGMLTVDMTKAAEEVAACRPGLPPPVLTAFADAAFNLGPRIACDTAVSTPARLLKSGDYRAACEALLKWDKAHVGGVSIALPGLTKRRIAERDHCLAGLDEAGL